MDRSAVKKVVDGAIEPLIEKLGVPHWRIEVHYSLRESTDAFQVHAACTRDVNYNRAVIEFDPDQFDDEAHVLKALRHELFHVVLSPFDLFGQGVEQVVGEASPAGKVLARTWKYAVEQGVINLERMFNGLTAEPPAPVTGPASEPDGPPAIS
jgi:hypothetical protein